MATLQTNTSTDQANIDAFNRVQTQQGTGNQYTVGKGITPVLSSSKGATTIDQAITAHNADVAKVTPTPVTTDTTPKPVATTKNPALENIGGITAEEANVTGADLSTYTLDPTSGYYIPKNNQKNDINAAYDAATTEVNNTFDSFAATLDAPTLNLVNALKGTYNQRIEAEKKANAQAISGAKTVNMRNGLARYAPQDAQNVLTPIEQQGLDRLKSIGTEEAQKIAEAQQNLVDKKYDLFLKKRSELNDLRKERTDQLTKLQDINDKKVETLKKQEIQATRDSAVAGLVSQGVTDPSEIMGILDEQAKASGTTSDFTAEEIGKTLKVLTPDNTLAGLSTDYRTYKYLTDLGDPSVKGLNYFEYQTAVANATRKPTGQDNINISNEKKTNLLGAGFSQNDIANIEKDVQTYGLDKVLEGITDKSQKKALQDAYGIKEKVTREQLDSTVTAKMAYDGLKETYTTDELKKLADDNGQSRFFTGKDTDIERFLNSPAAKKIYTDSLYKQYQDAGMAQ